VIIYLYKLLLFKEVIKVAKNCVLDDSFCVECGYCDVCDLEPDKKCDNCEKCLDELDYAGIEIDKIIIDPKK
jgi:hypothetical protein